MTPVVYYTKVSYKAIILKIIIPANIIFRPSLILCIFHMHTYIVHIFILVFVYVFLHITISVAFFGWCFSIYTIAQRNISIVLDHKHIIIQHVGQIGNQSSAANVIAPCKPLGIPCLIAEREIPKPGIMVIGITGAR